VPGRLPGPVCATVLLAGVRSWASAREVSVLPLAWGPRRRL